MLFSIRARSYCTFFLMIAIGILSNSNASFAVGNVSASGTIMRQVGSSFDVVVTVTGVKERKPLAGENNLAKDRIQLFIQKRSESKPVPWDTDASAPEVGFKATPGDFTETVDTTGADLWTLTFNYRITEEEPGDLAELVGTDKTLMLAVQYREKGENVGQPKRDQIISIINAMVKAAPGGFTVSGSNQFIVATWNGVSQALYTDDASHTLSKAVLIAVDLSQYSSNENVDVPSKVFDSTKTSDADGAAGSCLFNPSFVDGEDCVTCATANHYLDTPDVVNVPGFLVAKSSPSSGKVSITNLENGVDYATFMYFEPGGLSRSKCFRATPEVNFTASELDGEDEAKWDSPRCFVATAAYGSPLHRNIKHLVWFRDHVLKATSWGRSFVDLYYQVGPEYARHIQKSPALRFAVRTVLWPVTLSISLWRDFFESQESQHAKP